jgi:ABC-2 type transport system ATP-binding protein
MTEMILRTEHLTKHYGSLTAVDDLTLEVYEGEVFGFLGPNGAGKTTSINMMCGLLKPDAGRVTIRGVTVTGGDTDVRARVGVCPQEIVLWERLTCLEQLQFIGQMYGLTGQKARQRGEQLLEELDLVAKRDSQARTLSGGLQRRLNLAMALVHDPEIVVLDEPEAGLDPQSRVKVREYIQSLARAKTVILTTHNMDEADRVADRVAIIDHGQLLVLDTPAALKARVGEGDVVEIGLGGALDEEAAGRVERALAALRLGVAEDPQATANGTGQGLISQIFLDAERGVLTVRARSAVAALPAILDALETAGPATGLWRAQPNRAGQALQPSEVRVRENTLEDVFIKLTGRRLRE